MELDGQHEVLDVCSNKIYRHFVSLRFTKALRLTINFCSSLISINFAALRFAKALRFDAKRLSQSEVGKVVRLDI